MARVYSTKTNPSLTDKAFIYDVTNSDWRLTPFSAVKTLFQNAFSFLTAPTTQYLVPLTGFTETLTGTADLHLIVTPAGTLATGTVNLPASTSAIDKQTVTVSTSQEITALTVGGNGATVVGGPTTLSIGGYFTMKYDAPNATWYRVG